jgi:twinkle protein
MRLELAKCNRFDSNSDRMISHLRMSGKTSGSFRSACPLCSENRKPSNQKDKVLSVKFDGSTAVWMCHHCDEKGKVNMDENNSTSQNYSYAEPAKVQEQESNAVSIYEDLNADQLSYLKRRGISREIAVESGLVSQVMYVPKREEKARVIGFQYRNEDDSVAVKWRDGTKNFVQTGAAKTLWGIRDFTGGDLVITEGEIDALSFREVGIHAVSVPNGAPIKVSETYDEKSLKYMYLWDCKKYLELADRIIIATDSDGPGQALAEEIARRIGKARCWRLQYPEGCKDANDILVKNGEDGLRDALQSISPWPIGGLRGVLEYRDETMTMFRSGMDQAIDLGVGNLSDIFKPNPGTLVICTGIPGSGKSTFLTWLSYLLADKHDWPVAVFAAETSSQVHLLQLASLRTGKPFIGPDKMDESELSEALTWLDGHYVIIDESDTSIDSILERGAAAVLRKGVRIMMIDPYNFIANSTDGDNSTGAINKILVRLKNFATEHGISVWLVAHPKKMEKVNGANSTPGGYDISGSAHFFNVADNGLTIERCSDQRGVSRVISWKSRFSWIGATGSCKLNFNSADGSYSGLSNWGDDPADWSVDYEDMTIQDV